MQLPEVAVVSPGGVDLASGFYRGDTLDLALGDEASGGITFRRVMRSGGSFRTNWYRYLKVKARKDYNAGAVTGTTPTYHLEGVDGGSTFIGYPTGIVETSAPLAGPSSLAYTSSTWRHTDPDKTVTQFVSGSDEVHAASIQRINGVRYDLVYDGSGSSRRLRRVTSNAGYQLILEYSGSTGQITKACLFSTAVVSPPGSPVCPTGVQTVTYTWSGSALASVTNAAGATSTITYGSGTQSYTRPGDSQPWLVNTLQTLSGSIQPVVTAQAFTSGPSLSYTYENMDQYPSEPAILQDKLLRGTSFTVNSAATTTLTWGIRQQYGDTPLWISPGPEGVTDPLGRTTANTFGNIQYVPYGPLAVRATPEGLSQSFGFGQYGMVSHTTTPKSGSGQSPITLTMAYSGNGTGFWNHPASITDALGKTTDYTYSATHGGVETETGPAPTSGAARPQKRNTWAQYSASGGSGSIWLIQSTSQCQTAASCTGTSDEVVTTTSYNTALNLLPSSQTVTSNGTSLTTAWTYDANGNKLSEDGPMTGTADTRYWRHDAMRRVTGTIAPDPDGAGSLPYPAVRNTYDAAGRLTKVENGSLTSVPAATVAPASWTGLTVYTSLEATYDIQSRKLTETMKGSDSVAASLTQYSYDSFGRLECTATRMNPAIYTSLPSSACTMGAAGSFGPDRISKNIYDLAGQLLQVREGAGAGSNIESAEATYSYTLDGLKQQIVDANGNRAELRYDGFDRQVRWVFPSGTRASAYDDATPAAAMSSANALNEGDYELYSYDANGNRTGLRKRDGTSFNYTYDALNRLTVKDVPGRADLDPSTTRDVYYGYDLLGRQLYARFDSASGEGVINTFDGFGRQLSQRTTFRSLDQTVSYEYAANGNRTRLTYPDGNYLRWLYDDLGRPLETWRDTTHKLIAWVYDGAGRVAQKRNGTVSDFGFDALGRVYTHSNEVSGTAYDVFRVYNYNPAGQLTTTTRSNDSYAWTGAVNVDRNYTANGLNQYGAVAGTTFTYDANGNLTGDGSKTYLYDPENRLVSVTFAPGHFAPLHYDPLGRLIYTNDNYTWDEHYFVYDGDALLAEYGGNFALQRRYVQGPDAAADDPQVWYEGATMDMGAARMLNPDHQGSIASVTSFNGDGIAINRYDEYGIPQSTNVGRFQYTGQAWLPEIGMYYYKARMYSPTLGRFMQTDPIGYKDQVNLYAYVGDDPVNNVDPTGMDGACIYAGGCTPQGPTIGSVIWNAIKKDPGVILDAIMVVADIATVPSGEAAAGIALRRGAREAGEAATRRESGIVYRRTNPETGRCYIGRCNSDELFARRQRDHDRQQGTRHEYEVVERAKPGPALRQAEQRQIDAHGGPTNRSNPSGGTENKRNEIAPCRGTRIGNSGTGSIC